MADNDNRYKLWQTISKEYDLPDYNQFSKDMEDATKRKSLHDAVSAEYDLPDFDQFSKDMGYETQTTQQGNQNAQNAKKPQQTAQSSHVEEGRGLPSDNGYSKQKTAFDKAAEQAWNKLAHKGGIKWTIEGHPEVKMVAVTDDLVKKFPQLEQSRGYQVPFNMSTGTPIMQNIDDKGNIITPDEASEQYTKILTNQDFDYVPKQETAAVQIGSVVNTALSTKGGWLDRMARKSMAQYGDDWEHKKFESDGKEVSSSDVFGKVKQTIYDYYNSVLKGIRTHLMFNSDEEKQAYVDNLYKTGQLKEEDIPKANVLHYVQNVDKEEQIEAVRQAKLNRQLELEMAQEKFNQLPQREKGESDFDYNDRILHEGALYEQDIRKLKKQIAQLDAISDELQGNNTSWKEWGHAFKTSGIGSYHAWDLGATDLKDAIELNKVANGMKRGMQMTSSDYMALRVMSQANEADAIENAVMPVSYKSKKGGFISAPFTFGFFVGGDIAKGLTSAVNKVAGKVISKAVKGAVLKAGGKKALSAATNLAEKAANTKCVKLFGMLAKDFEKAAFMENTTGAATTGAEILNRHIGTVTESDDGFKMEGESLPTAIIKGEISQNIESQTEFLGEHFPSSLKFIRGMAHTKVGSAMGLRNLAAWLTKVSRTEFAKTLKSYATRAGINGVFGEYLEEVAGTAENALLVGDQKFSDLLDVKQQEEVAGSVVLSCLGMGIFGTAIYTGQRGLNMPTYYRLKHLQNKWDNAGLDLFTGDEWAKLKDRIDNTPNEGMKSVMADILRADNMTEEQARAAFNYARCSLTLRGMNLGAMKAAQLGLTDDRHIEQDNAYVEGRQAKDEDKHDIQIEFEDRSHELAEKLGISEQQLDNMSDEDLESLTGKDDQLDNLIYDYQTSHAKYQGVVDNADDEIDKAAQEAARQTDMATDKSRGTVRNATIKATKGEEDYGVYIVSGNVATNEDGSINVSESDDMILYYDPKSGKIEHCDAMHLAALGEEVNAEETRNQAIADAKEKAIRKQAGIIDGTVSEGTSFIITDAEGNEHTYEVLADNGDGSAMITMDGNVQDTPVSLQDLQNLKDAEEAKRLEAAKMQRQQYEEEREKQNAPVEDNLDYADIINTNGNVEIAEVVDEEGNAMFPDAEEVFFVQNQGSRAKVMVLDNEGNLQPKLVKKSSVRTLGTMSVDEYRQERQKTLKEAENASEPSLVDETEPSNNVVPTDNVPTDNTTTDETQPGNEAEVTTSDETQNISNEQENTPKITLEDGTEVPMLEDGNPDFSQLTAGQVAELYDSQFGEDAGQIITNNVNRSKKALDKANAMTVSGGSFVEQKASKEAKDKAIAEAKEKYDSAKAIEDAYNERMLAKEEDTPEGRMNLIEKARRKFNRMKGSVKDNAQAIAQLYDETVGTLLHRLYDSTGIDVFDDTANTVDEYVASSIAPYSLNYEGTETSKGVKQETGLSRSDFAKTGLLAKEGKGKTIGQLANDLWRDRPANLENITDQDVRNAIIDLITSGQTAFGLKNHIQNLRIAEAENILEQQKRHADELAHAEKQKEEEQASTEQSDDNTEESSNTEATPTDAQEEDKLADMPFEAPSPDEDVPFSAKDKAKDPLEVWNNMTDEEKAAYIENNRVKDTRLVDDVVGKKLRKAIEKIAGMMGATIQWQRTDMIRNGWFNPTIKTVYLALDSSVLEGVQFVFGHEMTHDIKSKSPAMYDELKKLVKEKYGEELFEAMTNDNEKRYADVGKTDDDRSYYEEETVADAIGDMINDLNLTRSIAFKMSHPLLAKMHDVLMKIKNAFTGTPYSDNVKGIIRTIEMAYVKTANREAVNTATQEDEGDVNYVIFKPEDMQIVEDEKFSVKSKPVRFEIGKKLSDEEKKEVLSTLKDAYKVNGVPYHIEETAGGKEKRVYEPTFDSYVVSDITNRPLRYYITLPDGRVAHPTEIYPNISDNEVKSSATKQGLLDDEADQIVSVAIGNMKGIADNAKAVEVLTELQNLPHETHDIGYGLNNAQSYNYKTGIFTSDAAQAIDYVVRRMRRKEDVLAEIPAALKKAVADSYGMVDNLIDGMSNTKVGATEIKPVGVGAFGNIYNQFRGKAPSSFEEFLEHPAVRYSIRNEKERAAAEDAFNFDFEKPKTQLEKDLEAIKTNDWNLPEEVRKKVEEKLEKYLVSKSGEVQQDIDVSTYFGKDNQTTAKNVLKYIIENSTDREIKNMAQYVLNNLGKNTDVPVKFFQNGKRKHSPKGTYYASTHSIKIDAKSLTGSNTKEALNRMEGTIIHEIAHAITSRAIDSDPAARKEILEIFSEFTKLRSQYGITLGYASKNPKEFVAEFLGNKAFREALMELPSSTKKVTLGQKILNFIKKILGIPVKNTFFNRTDDAILRLMDYANAREWDNTQSEDEEHPAVRYSIRNEKERAAAEDAYNFAQENRPDRYSRYAIVNMEKPGAVPQYLEKKTVADNWRRYYNKLKWGNYKLFDLDKPFEDNVKNLVGRFPETFRKKNDTTLSKINELTADYNKRKEEYDAMSNSIQELLNGLMKQGRSLAEAESVIRDWGLYKEMDSKYQNLMGIRKQLNELRSGKVADNNNGDFSTENDDIRYSLRVDRYRDELNQWKKDNNLPKDAERPQLPVREPNESAADFLKRVKEYRKQAALWATAPTYEDHLLTSDTAQGQFNLEMQRKAVLTRIVIQDSMLAIRKAQEAIMKEKGVDKLNPAEDAYTAENRSHGKAKNEFEEYNDEFLQPLRKAYNELMQRLGKSYDNVKVYMIAKHGLERNAYIAFKYALDEDYETNEERMNAYNNYKADMDRLNNDADFEAGRIDFAAWKQRDGFIRTKYAPSYFKFRFDENGMTKDYSGLSALFDADDYEGAAADLVKEVEDANPYYTDELWYATNDATKKILRDSYNAGMMTEDNFNFVSGMYRNYIPLRGWGDTNADQVWNYVGGGKGAFNQVVKEAKGRKSLADDPIAYIENMAESAILMNNRNWVKQHLLLLAQNHRTSLLNVSKAWYIKTKDAQGNEEWIPASPQITEGMTGRQVETALEAFEQKMEQMQQNGEATQKREHLEISYPQTNGEEREHEVRVMKGGEEYVIYVNGDPQLAQAVNNTRARKVREGIEESRPQRILARIGRYMAAAYTSMSPLFIPSNYMRDLTMTLASTAIREDARYNYLLRRNMLRHWNTFPIVLSYQNGTLREKVRNGSASRVEEMFYDFMMNGGETGFVTSVDVEDLKKKFKNDLKDLNRMAANPKKVGHIIMNSIETLNRAIEDSNRFMVYMTSIEYGRSIEEAVNNAKDVTLNFNRKGTGEHGWQAVRDMYLFINPAVQSLQTLGALAKHHPFKFTAVTTGWLATGLLVPMLNNLLMSFFGGDDDKDKYWQFTKWDRRNNFIMWIPFTKEFVKIPLAQEFRGFYGVGDMIASKLWGGEKAEESWSDYAWDLAGQIVDMLPLDPTGYDGNIGLAITPNAARPIGELALNVDFTGKPIFKNSEYNKYDPNFTKAYVGTPDWLVRISKMVNSIDNKYPDVEQNAIDRFGDPKFNPNNPAVIDHLLSSYLGGSYTMGSKIIGVATKALNGDDIKMADIPLASKFVSNPDDRPVSKKQGEEFWDMKERHDRAANTLSKLKKKAKVDGDYSTLDIFFGSDEYRQYKEDDKKVKKYEEDRKKEKAQETGEEYRPHKTTADDVYKSHTTPKDDFEDMKMKQLYEKLNSYKIRYEAIDGISNEKGDAYYKANKAAIDAIEEIAYDKSQIASIKKGFLSDGQNTYDADGMKDIRELRKRILDVLEKANKAMMNNRK